MPTIRLLPTESSSVPDSASHLSGKLHLRLLKVLHPTSVCYFIFLFGTLYTTQYKLDDSDFPSGSTEGRGRWVGITENVVTP